MINTIDRSPAGRPTIGLLTHGGGDPVGHFVWSGVASIARERGANLICFPGKPLRSSHGFEAQSNVLYDLVDLEMIHGLVLWLAGLTLQVNLEEIRVFCERYRPLPVVTVGVHIDGIPCVTVDNYHGMRDVVTHLVEGHGHTRIAFIRGPEHHQEAEERYLAYRDVLRENGLHFDPRLVVTGGFKESGGKAAITQLLDQRRVNFDAVAAASDNMAIGAIKTLQARGIRIPEDVAVVGLNNESEGQLITPPLTTGPLHFYEQGRKATEMVLDLLENRLVPARVVLPTKLLIRHSCGCADPLVLQAATESSGEGTVHNSLSLLDQINIIVPAISQAMDVDHFTKNQAPIEQLYKAFVEEIQGKSKAFLPLFYEVLRQSAAEEEGISKWHTAISVFRSHVLVFLEGATLSQAENLFQQARVIIGETAQRVQAFKGQQAEQRARVLSDINQLLSATIDHAELTEVLVRTLPQLDIPRGYITIYTNPGAPTTWSQLIMAYDESGPVDLKLFDKRFPSRKLLPSKLWPTRSPFSLVVEPLYFREDQLGLALFEADPHREEIYEILRGQISGALKRTRLAERNIELYNQAVQAQKVAEEGRQMAEQADSLKSRFLATVSHELRTPLTLIVGMIEILLAEDAHNQLQLPTAYQRDLKSIRSSAQHLGRLISDVLDLATSQAGELHLNCMPMNLGIILQEIILLGEGIVREKGLNWRVELTPILPVIWADRTRLRQIILNLISNAAKFTEQGEVALEVSVEKNAVTITIRDTGLGIPEPEQSNIFDEFSQSERTTQRGYGGIGLGLAITRRLVELHGGEIGVRSSGEEGAGSAFYFTLPILNRQDFISAQPNERSQKVLLLVDQTGESHRLREYLVGRGFEVIELPTANHLDWLTQVIADPPGAFVLDSYVAEERGWELIKRLRRHPSTSNIPVVFYSLSPEQDQGSILEMDYLTKPLHGSELVQALERRGVWSLDEEECKTILIVDDDPLVLNLHTRIVSSHLPGCRVLKARNGRESLDIMGLEQPDLVLLDLMMPEMDGFEVLEIMQNHERLRKVPVIVLTAQELTECAMTRLQRGVTAILSKGLFSMDEVLSQVEAALSRIKPLGNETQRMMRQVMAFIHEQYAEPITRQQLAQHAGFSERHLNRCFLKETGMPVMTYLNRYRVRQAKALLETGDQSVIEVALAVGFSSSNYFSRVFRQEVGITPGAYQRGEHPITRGKVHSEMEASSEKDESGCL
jgi:signal transduction histidine kinase/DNA-binding LacI/PurR family transcriptional regulator/DNA-binding response OmpR family regulator